MSASVFEFVCSPDDATGFDGEDSVHLASLQTINPKITSTFSPSVHLDRALVCTKHSDTRCGLLIFDIVTLCTGELLPNLKNCSITINIPITEARLLDSSVVSGDSNGKVVIFSASDISVQAEMSAIPTAVRDISTTAHSSAVCGGQFLSVVDLYSLKSTLEFKSDSNNVFSSIFIDNSTVSCTLENGNLLFFDVRNSTGKPTMSAITGKGELYAHSPLSSTQHILGFGDGQLSILDLRKQDDAKSMISIQDPYVEGIGKIKVNAAGSMCAVSGYTDFTLWNKNDSNLRFVGHSLQGTDNISNSGSTITDSTFWHGDRILTCWSTSQISIHHFSWP